MASLSNPQRSRHIHSRAPRDGSEPASPARAAETAAASATKSDHIFVSFFLQKGFVVENNSTNFGFSTNKKKTKQHQKFMETISTEELLKMYSKIKFNEYLMKMLVVVNN
jgi:hypothetical protein